MKTIEEKAKAYDEAVEKLKSMIPNLECLPYNGKTFIQDLFYIFFYIFPELKSNIKKGDKVKIHCNSSRANSIKRFCDNKIGIVHHVWDLERNPCGNIIVVVDGVHRDGFLYEELELLK